MRRFDFNLRLSEIYMGLLFSAFSMSLSVELLPALSLTMSVIRMPGLLLGWDVGGGGVLPSDRAGIGRRELSTGKDGYGAVPGVLGAPCVCGDDEVRLGS